MKREQRLALLFVVVAFMMISPMVFSNVDFDFPMAEPYNLDDDVDTLDTVSPVLENKRILADSGPQTVDTTTDGTNAFVGIRHAYTGPNYHTLMYDNGGDGIVARMDVGDVTTFQVATFEAATTTLYCSPIGYPNNDTVYLIWYESTGDDVLMKKSTDGGATFGAEIGIQTTGTGNEIFGNGDLALDGDHAGRIMVPMRQTTAGPDYDLVITYSDDEFTSSTDVIIIDDESANDGNQPGDLMWVHDNVWLVSTRMFEGANDFTNRIYRTEDGGDTWTLVYTSSTGSSDKEGLKLSASWASATERSTTVWAFGFEYGDTDDLTYAISTDSGQSWTENKRYDDGYPTDYVGWSTGFCDGANNATSFYALAVDNAGAGAVDDFYVDQSGAVVYGVPDPLTWTIHDTLINKDIEEKRIQASRVSNQDGYVLIAWLETQASPFDIVVFEDTVAPYDPEENWLDGWTSRKEIVIDGSVGAGNNYSVKLDVEYGYGNSTGNTIYTEQKSQTDFDDIRFTDDNGKTELDYWMEEYTGSGDATFWVEVADSLEVSGMFYMYYGNSSVSTTSEGADTFIFFDDFEDDDNLAIWDDVGGDWSTQDSVVKMGTYAAYGDSGGGRQAYYVPAAAITYDFMVHTWFRVVEIVDSRYKYAIHGNGDTSVAGVIAHQDDWMWWNGGKVVYEAATVVVDTWYRVEASFSFTDDEVKFWRDGSLIGTRDFDDYNAANVAYLDDIGMLTDGGAGYDQYQDDFYIREWVLIEPTVMTASLEQQAEVSGASVPGGWLTGWSHRKEINLKEEALAGRNYQIEFDVEYGNGVDTGNTLYCNTSSQTDFGDIRFAEIGEQNETILLDYYVLEYTASGDSEMWVEVRSNLLENQTIYMYYGNSTSPGHLSNGTNTFIFFDDFEDNDLDEWDTVVGAAISGAQVHTGSYAVDLESGEYIQISDIRPVVRHGFMVHWQMYVDNSLRGGTVVFKSSGGDIAPYIRLYETDTSEVYYYDGAYKPGFGSADVYNDDTWYEYELGVDNNYATPDPDMRLFMEGSYIGEEDFHEFDDSDFETHDIDFIQVATQAGYHNWADDFWVRRWQVTEPSVDSVSTEGVNAVPVIEETTVFTNPDDTNFLYAHYRIYLITANVSDADGFADIATIKVEFNDGVGGASWTVEFDEDTDTFSEDADAQNMITIEAGSCSNVSAGNLINVTFGVTVHWNHTKDDAWVLTTTVTDAASDQDTSTVGDYDIETELALTTPDAFLSDGAGTTDKGPMNQTGSITASGVFIYSGSGNNYPPTAEIDVYVNSTTGGVGSPWEAINYDGSDGTWSIAVSPDNAAGSDKYYAVPVAEGEGAGGLALTGDGADYELDWYYSGRIKYFFAWEGDSDFRVSTGATVNIVVDIRYDFTGAANDWVSSEGGTVTINGNPATANGTWSWYDVAVTSAAVIGYNMLEITVTGDTYGWGNAQNAWADPSARASTIIFDKVKVMGYTHNTTDQWIDTSEVANVEVWLQYEYDSTNVTDGTVNINGQAFTWISGGNWSRNHTTGAVSLVTFDTIAVAGNTHGITSENQNGKSIEIVFDEVVISISGPTDNRQSTGANATGISVTLTLSYNGTAHGGAATFNDTDWNGDGVVEIAYFTISSVNAGTYGITTIGTNDDTYMIWDQIKVLGYTSNDTRANINQYSNVSVWVQYDYDDTNVTDGTVTINGQSLAYNAGSGNWTALFMNTTVSDATWNVVVVAGNTHGITDVNQNGKTYTVIWDALIAWVTPVTDQRIDIGANATGMVLWANYSYDSAAYDGTLQLNDTTYNHGTVGIYYYNITTANGDDTFGITVILNGGNQTFCIFDSIVAWVTPVTDQRIDISANATGMVLWGNYSYDGTAYDGTFSLNDTTYNHGTVGIYYYNITTANGDDTFGITVLTNGGNQTYCIFDRIEVTSDGYDYPYTRINVGQNVTLWASARLDYDNHAMGAGDYIEFGSERMTWNGSYFTASYTRYTVANWNFTLNTTGSSEATFGITVGVNSPVNLTFDRILIYSMWVNDTYINPGDTIEVWVSLVSEFDNESMQAGLVQINGTLGTESAGNINSTFTATSHWRNYTSIASAGNYTFELTWANWTTFNITEINYNGWNVTYLSVLWDQIIVQLYVTNSTDNWDNITETVNVTVWLEYSDGVNVTDGTVSINGEALAYLVAGNWTALFSNATASFANWTTVATAGNTRGITDVDQNGKYQEFVWDSVVITITISDQRVDIGTNATVGFVAAGAYNSTNFLPTFTCNDTDYNGDSVVEIAYFNVTAVSGGTYGITTISSFDVDYVIWDQIKVLGYNTNSTDNRDDISDYFNVSVWIQYDYDDTNVTDGTVVINGDSYAYNAGLGNWTALFVNATVSDATWNTVVTSGNAYGITSVNQNGQSQKVIWDRIILVNLWGEEADNRTSADGAAFYYLFYCQYDYDNTNVTDDGTTSVAIRGYKNNGAGATNYVGAFNITYVDLWHPGDTQSSVCNVTFGMDTLYTTIIYLAGADAEWGLTELANPSNLNFTQIYDKVKVMGYNTNSSDNRDNIGTTVNVSVWIQYDYDDTNVTDGTIVINGDSFVYNAGSGNWTALFTNATVSDANWTTIVASGNTWGIDTEDQNGQYQEYIWDQIKILGYNTDNADDRDNINTEYNVSVWIQYDYDDTNVTDGTIMINGDSYAYNAGTGNWSALFQNATVSDATWNTVVASGNTYAITSVNQNAQTQKVIWDQLKVLGYNTNSTDDRDNINSYYNVSVWIQYDYDDTNVTDGTIVINGDSYAYNAGSGNWTALFVNATVSGATWNTVVASGNTHGITSVNQNGQSQLVIWDQIKILGYNTNSTDNRDNINTVVNVSAWVQYDYDDTNVTDGTIVINGDSYAYNAGSGNWTALFSNATVSDATWNTVVASGNTWGITSVNQNAQSQAYIWDQIKVLGYNTDNADDRDNINTEYNVSVWIQYDYDDTNVTDGTIAINGEAYAYNGDSGNWTALFQNATVSDATWNTVVASGNTYGITEVNQNGKSQLVIWDQLIVLGYNTNSTDNRDDINDYFNVSVWIQYDYDDTNVTDGTIVVNGDSYAYNGDSGNWTALFINATVSDATWNTVVASGNTYGITSVNQNGMSQVVIWDQIIVLGYNTNSTDDRDNIGTTVNVSCWVQYDYDDTDVIDGTIDINGDSYAYNAGSGNWTALFQNATVSDGNWTTVVASGNIHGITEVNQNGKNQLYIWDQILVAGYGTNSTDNWDDINNVVNLTVWIYYDYDNANVTDGNVWDEGQALAYIGSGGNWSALFSNATPSFASWNVVTASGNTWGITSVDQNSKLQEYVWDRLDITVAVNMTWTVVGYYANVSFTGEFDYNNTAWSEHVTVANTSIDVGGAVTMEELTKTTVGNYTFYTTVVEDATYDISEFITTTVWCVWDNVTGSVIISPGAEVGGNIPYTIFAFNLTWMENSSFVDNVWDFMHIDNDTLITTVDSDGAGFQTPAMWMVVQPATDTAWVYSSNATRTITGRLYNFTWYTTDAIIVAAEMSINVEDVAILDTTLIATGTTNVDFDWTIYAEGVNTTEIGSVSSEVDFSIEFDKNTTAGLHNYSIYFDAGASGNRWYNSSYYVDFDLNIDPPEVSGDYIEVRGTTNLAASYYVYAEGSYDSQTGSITPTTFSFFFSKKLTEGVHNYSLYFNTTDGVKDVWKNGSYYVSGLTYSNVFYISGVDQNQVSGVVSLVCNYTVYENDTYVAAGMTQIAAGAFSITWDVNSTIGYVMWGIKFNTSSSTIWFNGSYTPLAFTVTQYSYSITDEHVVVIGTPNKDGTSTLYHNDGGVSGGGNFYDGVSFIVMWTRSTTEGVHNMSLVCVSGTETFYINGSYYIGPDITDALAITGMSYSDTTANLTFYWNTNWWNTTGQFYYDDVAQGSAVNELTTLWFAAPTSVGDYNVSIRIYGGGTTLWVNYTYTVYPDPMYLIAFDIDTTGATVTGYAETNWNNATITIYENDVQRDTGAEGALLTYTKNTTAGEYNVALKIDGTAATLWFNVSYTVTAEASMYLTTYGIDTNGAIVTAFAETNWGNTTLTLYQNDAEQDTGGEGGVLSYAKSTVAGEYNVSLLVNGTGAESWVNVSYTIADNPMYLLTVSITTAGANVTGYAETNWNNATITIYENNAEQDTGAEGTIVSYVKSTVAGEYNVSLLINGTASEIWFNITYTVAENPMYLIAFGIDTTGATVTAYAETNWNNASLTLYENDASQDTGSEGDLLTYTKATVAGEYMVSLLINGTASELWFNVTYTIADNPMYLLSASVGTSGVLVTGYAETNWNNATLVIYENNVQQDTGAEGTTVSYTKAVVAGEYNVSLLINGTASWIWFNTTYTVAENPMYLTSFDIDTVGALVTAYAETNWNNATVTLYENDVEKDTGAEGDVLIYDKSVIIGDYNVSMLINGTGSELWINVSYSVGFDATNFAYIEVNLYGPDAIGIDPIMFKIYVNETRISSNWPRFYNDTTATYNITITNFLNESIISPGVDGYYTVSERMIDVSLNVYTFFVYSQLDEEFIYFNLTSGAGATWTGYVPPRDYIQIAIYASTDYTYAFTVIQGGKGGTFGGTINIDADFGIIINAYNLMDIFRGIQEVGGGTLSEDDITMAVLSAYGGPMGQIQFFSWLSAIMLFVGLLVVPFVRSRKGGGEIDVEEVMRTGGLSQKKKKGATPKQLKPYEFGRGPLNPKHKGKGMEDFGDFVWGRLKDGKKSGRKK